MLVLPEPQRRGEIKFKLAKFLPYNVRLALIAGFLVVGFAIQFILREGDWWIGVPFLAVGTLLGLVQGYDNKLRSALQHKEWNRVTRQQFERILELNKKAKSWDQTFLDITCVRGFLALLVIAGIAFYVYRLLGNAGLFSLADMWAVDAAVLVVPHWVVGVRSILTNAPLVIKIQNLLSVADTFATICQEGEEMQYMLELGETKGGKTPVDAKMVLAFHEKSPDFLGLQLQLAINNVQGTDYPYFYCVLVARPAFGLLEKSRSSQMPNLRIAQLPEVTVETKRENDVDIAVLRQTTTRTSGYHTKPPAVRAIFLYALAEARAALAAKP